MKNLFSIFILLFFSINILADTKIVLQANSVSASSTYKNNYPYNAVDGDMQTLWNSGKFASRWIQIDLGESKPLSQLKLTPEQTPAGNTIHQIYVGERLDSLELVYMASGYTSSGVSFYVPIKKSGRYIKIETTKSPSWIAWREIEVFQSENWVNYYGYYCSACYWVGNGNYITATSDHSNLAHVVVEDPQLQNKLQQAAYHDMKVIVDVSSLFFNDKTLLANYQERWGQFNNLIGYQLSSVAAFYLADESNRRGFSRVSLKAVVDTIKISHPDIPIASIFSGTEGNFNNVDLFDWVGVDCYDHGSGACYMFDDEAADYHEVVQAKYSKFRSRVDISRQRIILIPQAGIDVRKVSDSAVNIRLPAQAEKYLKIAKTDPLVIAVIPFIWQTFNDGENSWYGAEKYPALRDKFRYFGREITHKPFLCPGCVFSE